MSRTNADLEFPFLLDSLSTQAANVSGSFIVSVFIP
jgi:hypothetical protein